MFRGDQSRRCAISRLRCFAGTSYSSIHKTLRMTPAMAAKVTERLWEMGDIVDVLGAWEAAV
jgi:hypothetical protein